MHIRNFRKEDYPEIARIYEEGIATGMATFETLVPQYEVWNQRMLKAGRLVAFEGDQLIGWAGLSATSKRAVYQGVAEVSIYLDPRFRGKGYGKLLLEALITVSEEYGFWTLTASIFPQNKGSIALHESLGFRQLGRRERIAQLNGAWYDNLLFERRSKIVGI
ncbi:N-acetyltransferase family protein [Croceiramulus getboli]|nr:GNAT family N-acetyltransferase [Flavobacteriaceae bacterium YJPT1-3]